MASLCEGMGTGIIKKKKYRDQKGLDIVYKKSSVFKK
jgi:hypothetical protein